MIADRRLDKFLKLPINLNPCHAFAVLKILKEFHNFVRFEASFQDCILRKCS
jgi:hypothetical protein